MRKKYLILVLLSFMLLISLNFQGASGDYGGSSRDYMVYEIAIDNYSPGEFVLDFGDWKGENFTPRGDSKGVSGVLRRGWTENQYEFQEIKPFTDTRQVIDHYKREPIYEIRAGKTFTSISGVKHDLRWDYSRRTLDSLRSRRSGWWRSYCKNNPRAKIAFGEVESNSFQNLPNGFQYFQGFTDWRRYNLRRMGKVYHVYIPYYFKFPYEEGKKEVPVYTEENYTRYKSTTYDISDYEVENWPTLQAGITLRGKNGYEGDIQLSARSDNDLIDLGLENREIHVGSTARTQLTVSPRKELQGSTHQITLEARGSWSETKKSVHHLGFKTTEKPPVENRIIDQEISDEKPSETGGTNQEYRQWIGVCGRLYDAETGDVILRNSDGAEVKVKINDGSFKPAYWATNSDYEKAHHTYRDDEWSMELSADADGYLIKSRSAWDSTDSAGLTHKDFSLNPRGSH